MSGPLVGLVHDHGPRDHNAWAILVVLAERLHGPTRSWDATNEALAHDARLSPSSAKRGIAVLVAEGWVKRTPGRHKGIASTYWLDLTAFPEHAVEDTLATLAKGVTQTPSRVSTGGHTDPLREPKGVTQTAKGVTQTPHAVPVQEAGGRARVDEVDNPMPGVLTDAPRPCPKHTTGWHHDEPCRRCKALREYDEQQRAVVAAKPTGPLCGICRHPYDACRKLAAATNDPHEWTSTPSTNGVARDDDAPPRKERTNNNGDPAPLDVAALFANAQEPPSSSSRFDAAWERRARSAR